MKVKEIKNKTVSAYLLGNYLLKLEKERIAPVKVVVAGDEEGNTFGTIDLKYSLEWVDEKETILCIYPAEQFTDVEE